MTVATLTDDGWVTIGTTSASDITVKDEDSSEAWGQSFHTLTEAFGTLQVSVEYFNKYLFEVYFLGRRPCRSMTQQYHARHVRNRRRRKK